MEATVEKNLAEILGISLHEADKIWNATEKALIKSITEDPELRLRGFGTFVTVDHPAGTVKNPATGEAYAYPAYKSVDFRASKDLRQAVNPDHPVK
ncbi:MAG: HU family DNA-binding protein [Bacteroidia bacterium]|nr:HU family DNA-binding protein [Bacteroidia bacterium]